MDNEYNVEDCCIQFSDESSVSYNRETNDSWLFRPTEDMTAVDDEVEDESRSSAQSHIVEQKFCTKDKQKKDTFSSYIDFKSPKKLDKMEKTSVVKHFNYVGTGETSFSNYVLYLYYFNCMVCFVLLSLFVTTSGQVFGQVQAQSHNGMQLTLYMLFGIAQCLSGFLVDQVFQTKVIKVFLHLSAANLISIGLCGILIVFGFPSLYLFVTYVMLFGNMACISTIMAPLIAKFGSVQDGSNHSIFDWLRVSMLGSFSVAQIVFHVLDRPSFADPGTFPLVLGGAMVPVLGETIYVITKCKTIQSSRSSCAETQVASELLSRSHVLAACKLNKTVLSLNLGIGMIASGSILLCAFFVRRAFGSMNYQVTLESAGMSFVALGILMLHFSASSLLSPKQAFLSRFCNSNQLSPSIAYNIAFLAALSCVVIYTGFIKAQLFTTFHFQACQADRAFLPSIVIDPRLLSIVPSISGVAYMILTYMTKPLRMFNNDSVYQPMKRVSTGVLLSLLGMFLSAIVELYRRNASLTAPSQEFGFDSACSKFTKSSSLSAIWMLPQLILLGIADICTSIPSQEYFLHMFPSSLPNTSQGLHAALQSIGMLCALGLVDFSTLWYGNQLRKNDSEMILLLFTALCCSAYSAAMHLNNWVNSCRSPSQTNT